jgi:DNA-binding transcriptional ArsR family regulator
VAYQKALSALADPTRRRIFETLGAAPRSVAEIAAGQSVSRPAVSQHLKVLEEAGLVVAQASGTRRLYRISPRGLRELRGYLDGLWDKVLTGFAAEVRRQTGADDDRTDQEDD